MHTANVNNQTVPKKENINRSSKPVEDQERPKISHKRGERATNHVTSLKSSPVKENISNEKGELNSSLNQVKKVVKSSKVAAEVAKIPAKAGKSSINIEVVETKSKDDSKFDGKKEQALNCI